MNWYFEKISPKPESIYELIKDYSDLLAEGLQRFIDSGAPTLDVQPEAYFSERPTYFELGFVSYAKGCWYRYKLTVGGYHEVNGETQYVRYNAVPYNISIERADDDIYASDVDLKLETRSRIRIIGNPTRIE